MNCAIVQLIVQYEFYKETVIFADLSINFADISKLSKLLIKNEKFILGSTFLPKHLCFFHHYITS